MVSVSGFLDYSQENQGFFAERESTEKLGARFSMAETVQD